MKRILLLIRCIACLLLATPDVKGQQGKGSGSIIELAGKPSNRAIAQPALSASILTGDITACSGTASVNPDLGQFILSGADLTTIVTATAPAGFEVSANGYLYRSTITITPSGGNINAVPIFVRASATAAAGNISGNINITSGAVNLQVPVSGTVNDLPAIDPVPAQEKTAGQSTDAIHFTGTGNRYTWTNDNAGIGLSATGVGDIPSFPVVNKATSPIIATITATPAAPSYAYIANALDNTVSVVYIATGTIAATIPVGKAPFGVSANSDGSRVYVVNKGSDDVSVINTATNKEINRIPVGRSPYCDAVSPDGGRLYVTNYLDNTISVINTATNMVINTITVAKSPYGVRISPDGTLIYVTDEDPAGLSVINTVSGQLVKYILFPNENTVVGLSVGHDGKAIYVTGSNVNSNTGTVSVINTATNTVSTNISVDAGPSGICISPDNKRIYVVCQIAGTVMQVSTATNKVVSRTKGLINPFGISITPDGGVLFVTGGISDVSLISTLTSKITAHITAGNGTDSFGNFIPNISGCSGVPVQFTIKVDPAPIPVITASGSFIPLKTVYGIASRSIAFTVSGVFMAQGILIVPPPGYEASTDNYHFAAAVTVGSKGMIAPASVWIRIAADAQAGTCQGSILLLSGNTKNLNLTIANGEVTPAPLLITADDKTKMFGSYNPHFTLTYDGFQNNDGPEQLTVQPTGATVAVQYSPVGQYPISVTGAVSPNYTISYVPGVLSIIPVIPLAVPNTFTPNGDGINDTWEIKSLVPYPYCTVYVYNRWGENVYSSIGYGASWDGRSKGRILPFGTYYYVINLKNGLQATAGYVAIIR